MTPTKHELLTSATERHPFRVTVLENSDSEALLAMLRRCSPTALYRRFHGVTNGVFYAQQVLAAADCRDAYVAWVGNECVGLGNLHVCDDTADIGVLVQDDWQGRGVGSALLSALVRRIRERGSHFLRADVLDENRFALQVLARFGPARTSLASGSYTTVIDLGSGRTPRRSQPQMTRRAHSHPSNCARQMLGSTSTVNDLFVSVVSAGTSIHRVLTTSGAKAARSRGTPPSPPPS